MSLMAEKHLTNFVLLILTLVITASSCSRQSQAPPLQGDKGTAAGGASRPSAGSNGGEIDACALITKEEASEVLGAEVQSTPAKVESVGPPDRGAKSYSCRYKAARYDGLSVTVVSPATAADFESARQQAGDPHPVTGVGDQAFIVGSAKEVQNILVLKGHYYFGVYITTIGNTTDRTEKLKALAAKVASRLP